MSFWPVVDLFTFVAWHTVLECIIILFFPTDIITRAQIYPNYTEEDVVKA